jgi:serine protease SohB
MDSLIQVLLEFGLFLAKTVTILFGIGVLLMLGMRRRQSGHGDSEQLEITDLNHRYRELTYALKQFSLSKKAFKAYLKAERKEEKAREKTGSADRKRLFLIEFKGDIRASEVGALRVLVTTLLMEAREGDQVLVRLSNAGGLVSDHGLAASQLARIRSKGIPLTVAVDTVAASGGYLMACVGERIIAAPFAVIGSIGVLAELPNFHRLLERYGVDFELHTAGEYKRTLTIFGENTDEGRHKLREQLEETHGLFKSFVSTYRPALISIESPRANTGLASAPSSWVSSMPSRPATTSCSRRAKTWTCSSSNTASARSPSSGCSPVSKAAWIVRSRHGAADRTTAFPAVCKSVRPKRVGAPPGMVELHSTPPAVGPAQDDECNSPIPGCRLQPRR